MRSTQQPRRLSSTDRRRVAVLLYVQGYTAHHAGRSPSQRQISSALNISPAAVARAINYLVHQHQVSRVERVARSLQLTPRGLEVVRDYGSRLEEIQREWPILQQMASSAPRDAT